MQVLKLLCYKTDAKEMVHFQLPYHKIFTILFLHLLFYEVYDAV